jgi:N,N'-diacetylchitobiose transport system permease protein
VIRARSLRRATWDAIAVLAAALMAFPIYWMVSTALKPGRDILRLDPQWFPVHPTLRNFEDAIAQPFFWADARNSLVVTLATVALSVALAFMGALAIARFPFRGRTAIVMLVIGVQMVPLTALVIPIYLLFDAVGQVDQLAGVIVAYLAFVLPFMTWTLRGFVSNVPVELEEQAMIDGCSRVQAFLRIVFPLVAPGLVATSVYAFIQAWNEYIVAYVLLSRPGGQTLTVWLASFTTSHGVDWGGLMAGATLTGIPVVIFFLALQRYVVGGLTSGAVKG